MAETSQKVSPNPTFAIWRHAGFCQNRHLVVMYTRSKQRATTENGAIAQLVAHLHGMERVGGSNPPSSTTKPSSQAIWWFLRWFMAGLATPMNRIASLGAIAQLVAHLHGMERVGGSNPPSSTIEASASRTGLFRFLAYRPTFGVLRNIPRKASQRGRFRLARHRRER